MGKKRKKVKSNIGLLKMAMNAQYGKPRTIDVNSAYPPQFREGRFIPFTGLAVSTDSVRTHPPMPNMHIYVTGGVRI